MVKFKIFLFASLFLFSNLYSEDREIVTQKWTILCNALTTYYGDNESIFPETLDELVPRYIEKIPTVNLGDRNWAGEGKNTWKLDPTPETDITESDIDNSTTWIYNNVTGNIYLNKSGIKLNPKYDIVMSSVTDKSVQEAPSKILDFKGTISNGLIKKLKVSSNGKILAVIQPNKISIYDLEDKKYIFYLKDLDFLNFSNNGKYLILKERDETLVILDIEKTARLNSQIRVFEYTTKIQDAVYNSESHILAFSNDDNEIGIFILDNEFKIKSQGKINKGENIIKSKISPDGQKFLFLTSDNKIKIFSLNESGFKKEKEFILDIPGFPPLPKKWNYDISQDSFTAMAEQEEIKVEDILVDWKNNVLFIQFANNNGFLINMDGKLLANIPNIITYWTDENGKIYLETEDSEGNSKSFVIYTYNDSHKLVEKLKSKKTFDFKILNASENYIVIHSSYGISLFNYQGDEITRLSNSTRLSYSQILILESYSPKKGVMGWIYLLDDGRLRAYNISDKVNLPNRLTIIRNGKVKKEYYYNEFTIGEKYYQLANSFVSGWFIYGTYFSSTGGKLITYTNGEENFQKILCFDDLGNECFMPVQPEDKFPFYDNRKRKFAFDISEDERRIVYAVEKDIGEVVVVCEKITPPGEQQWIVMETSIPVVGVSISPDNNYLAVEQQDIESYYTTIYSIPEKKLIITIPEVSANIFNKWLVGFKSDFTVVVYEVNGWKKIAELEKGKQWGIDKDNIVIANSDNMIIYSWDPNSNEWIEKKRIEEEKVNKFILKNGKLFTLNLDNKFHIYSLDGNLEFEMIETIKDFDVNDNGLCALSSNKKELYVLKQDTNTYKFYEIKEFDEEINTVRISNKNDIYLMFEDKTAKIYHLNENNLSNITGVPIPRKLKSEMESKKNNSRLLSLSFNSFFLRGPLQ